MSVISFKGVYNRDAMPKSSCKIIIKIHISNILELIDNVMMVVIDEQ